MYLRLISPDFRCDEPKNMSSMTDNNTSLQTINNDSILVLLKFSVLVILNFVTEYSV